MKEAVVGEKLQLESNFSNKISELEEEVEKVRAAHENKFLQLREEASKLEDKAENDRQDYIAVEEKKQKETQLVENSLEILVNQEKKSL